MKANVYPDLYGRLSSGGRQERVATAEAVFAGLQKGDFVANLALNGLCHDVLALQGTQEDAGLYMSQGVFSAFGSAALVLTRARVCGFLGAIARAPQARSAIDAGTGASAVLAMGTALTHSRAEVAAYEADPEAAICAQTVVRLFGLDDRIKVVAADVLSAPLPEVDLGITETFGQVLAGEPGPLITARLSQVAHSVLPAAAKVLARDSPMRRDGGAWREAAKVDLTIPATQITGQFWSGPPGEKLVDIYAGYYDASGRRILTKRGVDSLTMPKCIGIVHVPKENSRVTFHCGIGPNPPARLTALIVQ